MKLSGLIINPFELIPLPLVKAMTRRWCWFGGFLVLCGFTTITYFLNNERQVEYHLEYHIYSLAQTRLQKKQNQNKAFLYLTQTESCIGEDLLSQENLGNSTVCNCHLLVLSYKQECKTHHPHIEYILGLGTTWSSGRNQLYKRAMLRGVNYLFYIFMDDDVELVYNNLAPRQMHSQHPMRAFEEFLLTVEPAVGTPSNTFHHHAEYVIEKRRDICHKRSENDLLPAYLSTVHFDGIFNAIHREAIQYLLPYPVKYDNTSWWHSQRQLFTGVEVIFRGQALMYLPVTVQNLKHRPYLLGEQGMEEAYREIIAKFRQMTPPVYCNNSLFQEFRKNPVHYTEFSSTFCMSVAPHHPIVPFAHFEKKSKLADI